MVSTIPIRCILAASLLSGVTLAQDQSIKIIELAQLKQVLDQPDDTLRVVNFWATWCMPCVKELPHFEAIRRAYLGRKVSVLLVSMDDRKDLNTKVIPFVRKRGIRSRVVLLDEPDPNSWIDQIAPEWSGALPMTLIVNAKQKRRTFIGKALKAGELGVIINAHKL
ncbi:redoxin domain-containing protein [Spirosoma taeanense]|uniref:Redoxin domain-containing protein n=1 Tax=Spirosoma taeanense TaxID=2735870 RepID=A0A6M5Y630_9BACT|nr:TlpA family protein disulfide reductase [Spirosoma taeanense]QJW89339.1 redoxin domain-containing protein [Spirosoma taeanense]